MNNAQLTTKSPSTTHPVTAARAAVKEWEDLFSAAVAEGDFSAADEAAVELEAARAALEELLDRAAQAARLILLEGPVAREAAAHEAAVAERKAAAARRAAAPAALRAEAAARASRPVHGLKAVAKARHERRVLEARAARLEAILAKEVAAAK